jgi:hypothetical protein
MPWHPGWPSRQTIHRVPRPAPTAETDNEHIVGVREHVGPCAGSVRVDVRRHSEYDRRKARTMRTEAKREPVAAGKRCMEHRENRLALDF